MWTLITASWLPLILAFGIGVLTGWWIWAHYAFAQYAADQDRVIHLPASGTDDVAAKTADVPVQTAPAASLDIAPAAPQMVMPKAEGTIQLETPAKKPKKKAIPKKVAAPKVSAEPKKGVAPVVIKKRAQDLKPAAPKMTALGIPAADGPPDDLLKLKGVGPKLNALLIRLGVTRFDQIAAWKAKEIALVDENLGAFKGRIIREEWVDQAKLLARGKVRTFEQKYGKLDSENV